MTQRNFSSETRVRLLSETAATSDDITSTFVYAPWSEMESESSEYLFGDLKMCFEKTRDRRRVVKYTSEKWHALGAMQPSSDESASRYRVRISTVVEEVRLMTCPFLLHHVRLLVRADKIIL